MKPVVEELLSQDRQWKIEIRRRDDGNFQVFLFRWTDEVVPDYGKVDSFWDEVHTAASITDTIERGRDIGQELLRTHAGADGVAKY